MFLPNLPQDKANHAFWGAVLACGLSFVNIELAIVAVIAAAILKEASDALINYRSTGNPMQGPHGVELFDALATITGGALVLIPQCLKGF
jgi:hypothetical protein